MHDFDPDDNDPDDDTANKIREGRMQYENQAVHTKSLIARWEGGAAHDRDRGRGSTWRSALALRSSAAR